MTQRFIHNANVLFFFSILAVVFQSCSDSAGGVNVWDAVESENLQGLDKYAKAGGDLNCQTWDEVTPLLYALRNNKRKSYERLLKLGANPNIIARNRLNLNYYNSSVMTYAASRNDSFWLKLALEHKGDPNLQIISRDKVKNGTVFTYAISTIARRQDSEFENIKLLVKHKLDLNQIGEKEKRTPLTHAAQFARFDVVYFLLESVADYDLLAPKEHNSFLEFMRTRERNEYPDAETNEWLNKVLVWLEIRGVNFKQLFNRKRTKPPEPKN